jgi:hypothetical protein
MNVKETKRIRIVTCYGHRKFFVIHTENNLVQCELNGKSYN